MIQQKCFFHKTNVIHKFCTLKQCTLPLCAECQEIHKEEHDRKNQKPNIISYSEAYNRTLNDLQTFLKRNLNTKNKIIQQLEADQANTIKHLQNYYKQKKQQINNNSKYLNDIDQKVNKLQKGSIKTLIYYYSGQILLKEVNIPEIRKLSKDIQRFLNNSYQNIENIQTFRQIQLQRQSLILKEIDKQKQQKLNLKHNKQNKCEQLSKSKQKQKQRKGIFSGHHVRKTSQKTSQKQKSHQKTNRPYLPLQMLAKDNEPYLNNAHQENKKQLNFNNNNVNNNIGKWRKFNYQVDKIHTNNYYGNNTQRQRQNQKEIQKQNNIKMNQNNLLNLQRYPSVNELIGQQHQNSYSNQENYDNYEHNRKTFTSTSNNGVYQLQSRTYTHNQRSANDQNNPYKYQAKISQKYQNNFQQDKPFQYHHYQQNQNFNKYTKNHLNQEEEINDHFVKNKLLKPSDLDLEMDPLPKYAQQYQKIERQRLQRARMLSNTDDNLNIQNRAKRTFSHTNLPHRKTQIVSSNTKNTSNHKDFNNQIASTTNNLDIKKQVLSPDEIRKMLQKRIEERSKLLTNKKDNTTTSTTNLRYSKRSTNMPSNVHSNLNYHQHQIVESRQQSRSPQRTYQQGSTGGPSYQTRNSIINQIYNQKDIRY